MNHEPLMLLNGQAHPGASVDLDNVVDVRPGTPEPADVRRGQWTPGNVPRREDGAFAPKCPQPRLDDVLLKSCFLKHLQWEKRRADRSNTPLSIAIVRPEIVDARNPALAVQWLEFIQANKRETDVLGYLGQGIVAVLLPDTNRQGTLDFTERMVSRAKRLGYSIATATYPDQLFESLLNRGDATPEPNPLLLDSTARPRGLGSMVKRSIDIVGACTAIVLLSPVMLAAAVAIAADSPGPIIFRQVRLGRGSVPFVFYKFRSMFCDVDDRIHREYVTSLIEGENTSPGQRGTARPWSKIQSDPRVTRVGHFIRRTSIDELPQLFNVLKGDLSLVGPRPPLPYEVEKYRPWHLRRILATKPGISGLWQIEAGSQTTFDDMVRMDLRYIRRWSVILDLKILAKTARIVLRRTGAG